MHSDGNGYMAQEKRIVVSGFYIMVDGWRCETLVVFLFVNSSHHGHGNPRTLRAGIHHDTI